MLQQSITQAFAHPLNATKKIVFRTLKYLSQLSFGPDVLAIEIVHVRITASHGAVNSRHCFHFTLYGAAHRNAITDLGMEQIPHSVVARSHTVNAKQTGPANMNEA